MKFAFRKNAPGLFDGVIRWWTKSPYSHCEVLLPDGRMFSAYPGVGTRYIQAPVLSPNAWDILEIVTTLEADILVQKFCDAELHCKYDWNGLWFSQVLKLQREHPHRWFCSEVCAAIAQRLALLVGALPCSFSPGKLYKRLKEAGAVVCA